MKLSSIFKKKKKISKRLPRGYRIISDGVRYKWIDDSGYECAFTENSIESCISNARMFRKLKEARHKNTWTEVDLDSN